MHPSINFQPSLPISSYEPREPVTTMIELTRLNGTPMLLNSDLIKSAEASPDTMLTLIHGEKLIVRETLNEVMVRVLAYRALLLTEVARRLHTFGDLQQVVALSSLDVSGQRPQPPEAIREPDPESNR
jgi:flagellar protein FlbD